MSDVTPQLSAEDFSPGGVYAGPPRVLDDGLFLKFAEVTGDRHPIHYDRAYAATTPFGRPVAHGLLLMALTATGATPLSDQLRDSMIALVEQGCRFLKPAFVGDTVTTTYTVASVERKPGKGVALVRFDLTMTNAKGEALLGGHHSYLLRRRQAG